MSISVLRTADSWYVATADGAARIKTTAGSTAQLLHDREAITAAVAGPDTVPAESLAPVSPITTPCRVVAQMTCRGYFLPCGVDQR